MQRCCWLAAVALCASASGDIVEDRIDAARRQLTRAVTPEPDNAQLGRLAALRSLRDDRLEPLFRMLVEHDQWPMQVHGVLGLAELGLHTQVVDLLMQVDARAREQAVLVMLDTAMLDDGTLLQVQTRDLLEPQLEARLLDEMIHRDLDVDDARLEHLLSSGDPRAAGRSAMLLATRGGHRALPMLDGFIMQWEEPRQLEAAFAAMQTLQRHPSPEGVRWVDDLLEAEARSGPRRFALMTLMKADPQAGTDRWDHAFAEATRHRERVDLALIRLMASAPFPAHARGGLTNDPLLSRIADAADALSNPSADNGEAIEALVTTGHGRSIEWLLNAAGNLDPVLTLGAMERLIERVPVDGASDASAMDRGVRAALILHDIAPGRMRQLLSGAPDDSPRQQALLLAALQLDDPGFEAIVANIRRIGLGQADALALLLQARWAAEIDPAQQQGLALITDGTRLSDPLRTQAAWLLLRHTGHHGPVLRDLHARQDR